MPKFGHLPSFSIRANKIGNPEELGRKLFFDPRLSSDGTVSCATCHLPELAFTDGKTKSEGVAGRHSFRNAPSLLNIGDAPVFMFDAHIRSLEEQAIVPIQDSNEMNSRMGDLIQRLKNVPEYADAAKKIYHRSFDPWVLTRSLAAFERTLSSKNSAFDAYLKGEEHADWNSEAENGWKLFQKLRCIECHQLPNLTNYEARNNGLYDDYGDDQGRFRIHGDSSEIGAFKVPSLRNVALTAPYMHDGSLKSLEAVIDHYRKGGSMHPNKASIINKNVISTEDEKFLIQFLYSLTDTSYMVNFR